MFFGQCPPDLKHEDDERSIHKVKHLTLINGETVKRKKDGSVSTLRKMLSRENRGQSSSVRWTRQRTTRDKRKEEEGDNEEELQQSTRELLCILLDAHRDTRTNF